MIVIEELQWLLHPLTSLAKEMMIGSKTSVYPQSTHSCFRLLCKIPWAWALVHVILNVTFDSGVRYAGFGASMFLHSAQMLTGSTCFWRLRLAVR